METAAAGVLLIFTIVIVNSLPTPDPVLLKTVHPRYQYVQGPDGLHLEDMWVTMADVTASARYNPDVENIYYHFSRAHPNIGYPLLPGNSALLSQTDFIPLRPTVVIVHGWQGSAVSTVNTLLVPAFLHAGDYNVIVVDWNAGAAGNYIPAVSNVVTSGQGAARFLDWLCQVTGASVTSFHLVGHSLGGHQVGIIGRHVTGTVGYITSLDPAFPLWVLNSNKFRADDGAYTEVMHTNVGEAGYLAPLGHVDFYPNRGNRMPGCNGQSCDHNRCCYYMAESVYSGGFTGVECASYLEAIAGTCSGPGRLQMGGVLPKTGVRGVYYLTTNAVPPFSIS